MRAGVAVALAFAVAGATALAQPLSVADDTGVTVTLARPAKRIVALAPHIVENLYAVGAGEQIVGAVEFSDYPSAAHAIPRIGSYDRFDVERIVSLAPDLVIGWESGNNRAQLAQLQTMGLPVYRSQPDTIDAVADELSAFGRLSGNPVRGDQAAADYRSRAAILRARFGSKARVPVFYQIWDSPLMTVVYTMYRTVLV